MMDRTIAQSDLNEQVKQFEQQNPKIAEAISLFHISLDEYEKALHALNMPHTYEGDSTTPIAYLNHDSQE